MIGERQKFFGGFATLKAPVLALFAASLFPACTDYVEEYESEYRADYGNADVFESRLNDASKWDWKPDCQDGDVIWEWCFASDGKYAPATFAGASWESFVKGDARLVFSGTDNGGHSYTTNLLTEDNVLHMLRSNGGLRLEVAMASGEFSAGVQVKLQNDELDKSIYPAMVLLYTNECADAFAGLKYVDDAGNTVSEYRWDKLSVGEQVYTSLEFDDLHYTAGEKDEDFLKKANTFEVGLSGCSDSKKGLMVYAVGVKYSAGNEGNSSSSEGGSNGSSANSNGGNSTKSSSSSATNVSGSSGGSGNASSSSSVTSNGSTTTTSSSAKSSSSADTGFLWRGADKSNYVETDFGSDSWAVYTDPGDQTVVLRPQPDPYEICLGQCGLVSFGAGCVNGADTVAPYASISFDIANGTEANVSDRWGGVCVTYATNDTATLYLSMGLADSLYGNGMPMVKLPPTADKDTVFATVHLKWDQFKQPTWAKGTISGPAIAEKLRKIEINFDGEYGNYGKTQYFNIYEIGSYGKCGPTQDKNIPTWSRSKFYAAIDSSKLNIEPYAPLIDKKNLLWYGGNKIKGGTSYRVQTGLEYDYPNYEYDSYLQFAEDNADKRISNCNGSVCGTVKHSIVEGGAQFRTAAIFFEFAPSANLKEWGGLCVTYSSDKKMWLQLGRSNVTAIRDTIPLEPTTDTLRKACFSWLDFGAYTYGATLKDGRYLDKVNSVKFRFLPESYDANFKIVAIGKCTECKSELAWDFLNPDITYDTIIDSRDKQPYKYVRIGNYEWMAENLNYDGSEGVCSGNDPKNCAKFGRLYSPRWDLCPDGWHLPNEVEFKDLIASAGGAKTDDSDDSSASNLKSLYGWNGGGTYVRKTTDKFGFSAVPAGYADEDGTSRDFPGKAAYFWGQRGDEDAYHYYVKIHYTNNGAELGQGYIDGGTKYSIRCVRGSSYDAKNGTLKDFRDGRVYKTTVIGDQTWMAENLNYDYHLLTGPLDADTSSFCYSNKADICATDGRLYVWSAAMDSAAIFSNDGKGCGFGKTCSIGSRVRGVCPDGWHLPSKSEWNTLLDKIGGSSSAALKLKKITGWNDSGNGTDDFGFSVLPTGYREVGSDDDRIFINRGNRTQFWTTTEDDSDHANYVFFTKVSDGVTIGANNPKKMGFAVRCVKD